MVFERKQNSPHTEGQEKFQAESIDLLYTPSSSGTYEIPKQKEWNEIDELYLPKDYFKRLAMQDSPLLSRMCEMIEYKKWVLGARS